MKQIQTLDPRSKLILVLVAPHLMGLPLGMGLEIYTLCLFLLPFIAVKKYRLVTFTLILYVIQWAVYLYLLPTITKPFAIYSFLMFSDSQRRMLPGLLAGLFFIMTTPISDITALGNKYHLPQWFMTPIVVMIRFIPALYHDYHHIKDAMALRGIQGGIWGMIRHPVQTYEYILIPLLMNATQVSEDLTIAALTKGMSIKGRHTSLTQLKWRTRDTLYTLAGLSPYMIYLLKGS